MGYESAHSLLSSLHVTNEWICNSASTYASRMTTLPWLGYPRQSLTNDPCSECYETRSSQSRTSTYSYKAIPTHGTRFRAGLDGTNSVTGSHCIVLLLYLVAWAGERSRYSDWLRAGRSGDQIPVGARFSAPVQTGPGAHPASCTIGTGSFTGVKIGRSVTLTPHSLLVP